MRSRQIPKLWAFAAVVVAVAALAYLLSQAPEFMGRVQDPELMSMDPATSNFIASGGLVPDSAPQTPSGDEAANHAAVAAPIRADAGTF